MNAILLSIKTSEIVNTIWNETYWYYEWLLCRIQWKSKKKKKDPKFKVSDHVRISKCKNILLKDTLQIGQKKFLLLATLKIQFLGLMLLMIRMVQKLLDVFTKKNCGKLIKKKLK